MVLWDTQDAPADLQGTVATLGVKALLRGPRSSPPITESPIKSLYSYSKAVIANQSS